MCEGCASAWKHINSSHLTHYFHRYTDAVTSDPAHGPALALLALILGALKTTHGFRQVRILSLVSCICKYSYLSISPGGWSGRTITTLSPFFLSLALDGKTRPILATPTNAFQC